MSSASVSTGPGGPALRERRTERRWRFFIDRGSTSTDPETLEFRAPVRLEQFVLRSGSGGAGQHRGGEGVLREFTILRPLRVSMLSERRQSVPFGLAGGRPGTVGQTLIDGAPKGGRFSEAPPAGSKIRIETLAGGLRTARGPRTRPLRVRFAEVGRLG